MRSDDIKDYIVGGLAILMIIGTLIVVICSLTGCTPNTKAKNWGGTYELHLEPNMKLEEITWKDDGVLWYLVRPMEEDDEPEIHYFKEDSPYGMIEGEVVIIETKEE